MSQGLFSAQNFITLYNEKPDFAWVYPAAMGCGSLTAFEKLPCGGATAFLCVLEGEGEAQWDGGGEAYRAGCVLCAAHTQALSLRPQSRTRYICLLLSNAKEYAYAAAPCIHAAGKMDSQFLQLWELANTNRLVDLHTASSVVYTLLMNLLALAKPSAGRRLLQDAIAMMEEDYHVLSGVEEIGDRLGVTKHHLIRLFSGYAGISPGQYLQQVRIHNAKLLLRNREYSVETIACMVGYSGSNYFCKVFKRATGETPGEFRDRSRAVAEKDTPALLKELERVEHTANL